MIQTLYVIFLCRCELANRNLNFVLKCSTRSDHQKTVVSIGTEKRLGFTKSRVHVVYKAARLFSSFSALYW